MATNDTIAHEACLQYGLVGTPVVWLGVVARGRQLAEVKANVDLGVKNATDSIIKAGMNKDAIRTSSIDYSTSFTEDDRDFSKPIYKVDRDFAITVLIEKIDVVLQNATKAGVYQILEVRYLASNSAEISRKTLLAAIDNLSENARTLAQGFNTNLGKVVKIQSDRSEHSPSLSLIVNAPQDPSDEKSYAPNEITILRSITVVLELTE